MVSCFGLLALVLPGRARKNMPRLCDLQRCAARKVVTRPAQESTQKHLNLARARALHNISTWIPSLSESDKLGIKWKCYGTRARHVLVYGEASYGGGTAAVNVRAFKKSVYLYCRKYLKPNLKEKPAPV